MVFKLHSRHPLLTIIMIIFINLFLNFSLTNCQQTHQETIVFKTNAYFNTPQIHDSQYSIVSQIPSPIPQNADPASSTQNLPLNTRFVSKKPIDYYAVKSLDAQYRAKKYNYIIGKNIFTPEYINSQVLQSTKDLQNHSGELIELSNALREEFNQNIKDLNEVKQNKEKQVQAPPKNIEPQKQQIIEQKSTQLYNQFKTIEQLKDKNLRDDGKNKQDQQRRQNLQKLIGYIVIGLVISFVILKKATKSSQSLPKGNQQRTQLRLKGADDQEDEEQVSSSQSD